MGSKGIQHSNAQNIQISSIPVCKQRNSRIKYHLTRIDSLLCLHMLLKTHMMKLSLKYMEARKSATHTKKYSFVSNLGVGAHVQLLYVAPYVCDMLLVQQQPAAGDMATFHLKYDESMETSPARHWRRINF